MIKGTSPDNVINEKMEEDPHFAAQLTLLIKEAKSVDTKNILSFTEISQVLSVPKSNVCYWRDHLDDEKKAKIEQTVLNSVSARMSDFLNASYQSMAQLAEYCSTKEFVMSHPPEQIAKLIDVLANQAFALIEAQQRADLAKMSVSEQKSGKT